MKGLFVCLSVKHILVRKTLFVVCYQNLTVNLCVCWRWVAFIDCKRKIYLLFIIFVINFDWLQLCLYEACGKLNYYSNAFALRLKHSYSYIIFQIAFFFTCVGIFIWSTLCLLSLLNSLLFPKSTERYSISNLSSLLHVMPSHFINIRVINDITCQSFFWKEYLLKIWFVWNYGV